MTIALRRIFVFFLAVFIASSGLALAEKKAEEIPGTISGQVLKEDGSAFPHGFVAFFDSKSGDPQDFGSTHRSPVMIAFIGEDGKFSSSLMAPGSYYLGAIPRKQFSSGPPSADEKRYSSFDVKGNYNIFVLADSQDLDIGTITVKEPKSFHEIKDFVTIEGKVFDESGKAAVGSLVLVKKDLNDPKALFISGKTKADGSYKLKVPPGKYFLVARERLTMAGRPKPGSSMGVLGQNTPIGIGGKSEDLPEYLIGIPNEVFKDVNITMFKVPLPDVKRKEIEAKVKAKELNKDTLPANLPLMKATVGNAVESKHKGQVEKPSE